MWHVLFVMTNNEDKVVDFLRRQIQALNVDMPYKVFCPTRKLVHLCKGEKTEVSRVLFPGYIFMEMEETAYFRRMLRRSTKFFTILRDGEWSFETMRQDEIDAISILLNDLGEIEFSSGLVEDDRVRVLSGPLKNYCGKILKINKRECKAKIQLTFRGYPTYTYVGLNAVEKFENDSFVDARDFYFTKT